MTAILSSSASDGFLKPLTSLVGGGSRPHTDGTHPEKRLSARAHSSGRSDGASTYTSTARTAEDEDDDDDGPSSVNGNREEADSPPSSTSDNEPRPSTVTPAPRSESPPVDVNPIFEVRKKMEQSGESEAYLDKTKQGDLVVKPGRPPGTSRWAPWRSDTPASVHNPAAADVTRAESTPPRSEGGAGPRTTDSADPSPAMDYRSSSVDSVRMKIFTKLLPDGVSQPDDIARAGQAGQDLDLAAILGTRPRSPEHLGHSAPPETYPSPRSAARQQPLPKVDGEPPRAGASAQGGGKGSDAPASAPRSDTAASASAANSRHVPPPALRPPDSPPSHSRALAPPSNRLSSSPSKTRMRGAGGVMQRSNTVGPALEREISRASSSALDASSSSEGAPPPAIGSSSRLMPPSPSLGQRAKSFDPAHVTGRRTISATEPTASGISVPKRSGSGDEFEDEMARKADVLRKERMNRRAAEAEKDEAAREGAGAGAAGVEDEKEGERDKGKRRVSGATSDGEGRGRGDVLVGNLISEGHANYVLMYNMLTGIRIGVSRCQAKVKRPLTDEDYTARHKFSFDIVGNELTPSAKYDFKFKDYAPWVFRELREYFHLDPADYLLSLTAKYILSELGSPGKSGSFFYFSRDYRFIIKTIHHSEHKFLRKILKQYHEHVKKNPHTLLSRFYGLHRVKLPRGRKIHFVIMNNLFPPHRDIHETYDLKGSSIGREYPEEKASKKPGAVLKDLNWVHRGRVIDVGPEKRALFEEQLRRDTELLQRLGIMDYSLLIGFHNMTRGNKDKLRDDQLKVFQPDTVKVRRPTQVKRDQEHAASALRKAVQRSDPKALSEKNRLPDKDRSERRHFIFYQDEGGFQATGDENEPLPMVYYLGIIDILTPYSTIKQLEHCWKGMSHDKHQISAVPPVEYGNRFLSFLFSIVRGGDPSIRPKGLEAQAPAHPPAVPPVDPPDSALRKEVTEKPPRGPGSAQAQEPQRDPEKPDAPDPSTKEVSSAAAS